MDTTQQKPKVTPKDFFLWLGAMVALYISATSLILLVHQYINIWFPSELERYGADFSSTIRIAISSLVVVFPLYVWLTRILHQDIRMEPIKKELWVRRWLIFLTLFVAGGTIAIDLISLIYTFLDGELTARFTLKALTILIVLGGGFWYYLKELHGIWEAKESLSKMIGGAVALVVLVAIVGGFFIIGSPNTQRLYKLDEQKTSDLQTIQWQIVSYWQQKETLPDTLDLLEDPLKGYANPVDPQTGESYVYTMTGPLSFDLCATFNLASRVDQPQYTYPANESWQHEEGEVCFSRTIDPDLYGPTTKDVSALNAIR